MDILGLSWLRYLDLPVQSGALPPNAYQGDYVVGRLIVREIATATGTASPRSPRVQVLPPDAQGGDKKRTWIRSSAAPKRLLGEDWHWVTMVLP